MYDVNDAVTAPARLRAGLGFVFWGMLLVVLDFRVNDIDVIPDIPGWVLLAVGSGRLMGQSADGAYEVRATAAWVMSVAAALLSFGDLMPSPPAALAVAYLVLAVGHPIVVSAAMLRLTTVAGAEDERRSWHVSLWALVLSIVVGATTVAIVATGGADSAPVAVFVVLFAVAAVLHYLVSLWRSRRALDTDDAGGRMLGATPDDVSRGVTSAPRPSP